MMRVGASALMAIVGDPALIGEVELRVMAATIRP